MATLLAKAVIFKSLIKQLSKQEFLTSMGKIYDMNQSDLIPTALFNYFIHPPSVTNPNPHHLAKINSILSQIMQSREKKPKPIPPTDISLDKLPRALIGQTASFLTDKNYFRFGTTNRSIFIGCNAPNMLTELDLRKVANYSSVNLPQFKSLKTLKINLSNFKELSLPQTQNGQFILNRLEKILLNGKQMNDIDIEPFMNQNCININNIKILCFHRFGKKTNRFNKDKFWRLLTHFKIKNVEYLEIISSFLYSSIKSVTWRKLYDLNPKLKGICVAGGLSEMNNDLVNTFGNNLQFLTHWFYPPTARYIDFNNINFSKLQEVALCAPSTKTTNEILKSGQNIKKVYLSPSPQQSPSAQQLKIIIPQIFECKSLEYFGIEVNDENYRSILYGIEVGLFQNKKIKRKQIKIRMNGARKSKIDLKGIIFNISRIILLLVESSEINDFMFICDMNRMNKEDAKKLDANDIVNDLNDISRNIKTAVNGFCFVITNRNCNICGWNERWLIQLSDVWKF